MGAAPHVMSWGGARHGGRAAAVGRQGPRHGRAGGHISALTRGSGEDEWAPL
jgi:hypothetical protein